MINTSLSGNKNNPGGKPVDSSAAPEPTIIRPAAERPNFEARVGFFATVAAVILLYGWGWLKGLSIFHPPQRFSVAFHDIEGLNTNAPVNTNGYRVGIVEKIELKKNLVLVHLKINTEDVRIPEHSKFSIQTLGLVGAKYMEITIPQEALADATSGDAEVRTHMLTETDPPQVGDDPVRMELYVSNLASKIGNLDIKGMETSAKHSMDELAEMAKSMRQTSTSFGETAPDFKKVARTLDKVATKADGAVGSANKFFQTGSNSLHHINTLTDDLDTTANRANKILANPNMSGDLKATADQARIASENIQKAIHELNGTLGDKQTRLDLQGMLVKMQASTENIAKSIATVNKVADDKGLRSDIKEIVTKANSALDKVNGVVNQPTFGADLTKTLGTVRQAASHVDEAAQQINATVSEPHFLWHQINPFHGKVKVKAERKVKTDKSGNKEVTTKATTKVPASQAADTAKDVTNDTKNASDAPSNAPAKSEN
jgi:ABC-type transporter Mla subunit MlaD